MTKASLGFIGSSRGTTAPQFTALRALLAGLHFAEAHHGDEVGADTDFHDAVRAVLPATRIVVHPSEDDGSRAYCDGDDAVAALPAKRRNAAIVQACDVLCACPDENRESTESTMWVTVRKAQRQFKPVVLVYPDGSSEGSIPESA